MNNRNKEDLPVVVIMAGGKGTRIRSIASDIPKPMIPIAGKPVLEYELESLRDQGFDRVIITAGHLAEAITSYFGDGSRLGITIEYYIEEKLLGNAGALFQLWKEDRLTEEFLLLNADAVFDVDFRRFLSFHDEHQALATLFTHPNAHPYDSALIFAEEDSHVVTGWLNKEDERPLFYRNRVNAGLHILNTEILRLSGISLGEPDRKIDLDRDILKPLVSSGRIYAYDSPEYCKDMGTPERFRTVSADLSAGLVKQKNLHRKQRAIFLDRDGTINAPNGFIKSPSELWLIEGAAEAIRLINASGYLAIVITNQPVIARGEVTVEGLREIHNKLETLLGEKGAFIDGLYYCPHHPDGGFEGEIASLKVDCACRKPKPGLLFQAAGDFNIDLSESFMIGDSWRDVEAGKAAGCKTVLLPASSASSQADCNVDHKAEDLLHAVRLILQKSEL